jgi:hypothetical protein
MLKSDEYDLDMAEIEANFFAARTFLDIVCLYYELAMIY